MCTNLKPLNYTLSAHMSTSMLHLRVISIETTLKLVKDAVILIQ